MHPIAWLLVLTLAIGLSALAMVLLGRQRDAASPPAALRLQSTSIALDHRAYSQLVSYVAHARRYQRPLSALILSPDDDDLQIQFPHLPFAGQSRSRRLLRLESPRQSAALRLTAILHEATRESDIVMYDTRHNHFVILFPETDKPQAVQAMQRLGDLIYQRTSVSLRSGVAQFPADGVTLEALLHSAQTDCNLQKERW